MGLDQKMEIIKVVAIDVGHVPLNFHPYPNNPAHMALKTRIVHFFVIFAFIKKSFWPCCKFLQLLLYQ